MPPEDASLLDAAPAPEPEVNPAPVVEPPAASGEPEVKVEAAARPDNIPEQFWKDGALDTDGLLNSYKEVSEKAGKYVAPEAYAINRPEGVNEVVLPDNDPLLAKTHEWGKKWGMPQEALDEIVGEVLGFQMGVLEEHHAAQRQALGPEAANTIGRVEKFLRANLDEKEYAVARTFATTAEGIKVLDKIRSMALKEARIDPNPGIVPNGLTQADVDGMMKSDDYWNASSPNYKTLRDKVAKFYQG